MNYILHLNWMFVGCLISYTLMTSHIGLCPLYPVFGRRYQGSIDQP